MQGGVPNTEYVGRNLQYYSKYLLLYSTFSTALVEFYLLQIMVQTQMVLSFSLHMPNNLTLI